MNNPYKSPSQSSEPAKRAVHDEAKIKLARLAWASPIICFGLSAFINIVSPDLAIVGGFAFLLSIPVGLAISIATLFFAKYYRGVFVHGAIGLAVNLSLAFLLGYMIFLALTAPIGEPQ